MDNDTFRTLWSKILTQDHSQNDFKGTQLKPEEMTYSHNITVSPQQNTFSGSDTKYLDNCSPTSTFSEESTVSLPDNDSSCQASKLNIKDVEENATFSTNETIAPGKSKVQINFTAEQDYQNYEEINRGGMGIIYKAEQTKLKREIAIKKTLPGADKNKFLAESLVTAYLEHPNIVPVHEIDHAESNEVLLAMKLVKGISLKELLYPKTPEQKNKAQEYDFIKYLQILFDVCNAIEYSHSKGIVHCDLKPDNIMIGDFGEVLVMDWGIAIDVKENPEQRRTVHKSQITTPLGTPCYMPPELAEGRGKDISYTTDVYLIGGILCEILNRKPLHTGESIWKVLLAAKESKAVIFDKDIPLELQQICHKATAKENKDRYPSVSDFKKELTNYLQRRESIEITQQAEKMFVNSKHIIQEQGDYNDGEWYSLYENLSQCIALFHQAHKKWPDNHKALQGEKEARIAYADFALIQGDLGVANTQIKKLQQLTVDTTGLQKNFHTKTQTRKQEQRITFYSKWAIFLVITAFVLPFVISKYQAIFYPEDFLVKYSFFSISVRFLFSLLCLVSLTIFSIVYFGVFLSGPEFITRRKSNLAKGKYTNFFETHTILFSYITLAAILGVLLFFVYQNNHPVTIAFLLLFSHFARTRKSVVEKRKSYVFSSQENQTDIDPFHPPSEAITVRRSEKDINVHIKNNKIWIRASIGLLLFLTPPYFIYFLTDRLFPTKNLLFFHFCLFSLLLISYISTSFLREISLTNKRVIIKREILGGFQLRPIKIPSENILEAKGVGKGVIISLKTSKKTLFIRTQFKFSSWLANTINNYLLDKFS
ncbi:serine/threonine-protein kinase [Candidatus Uabimicrobium amorphum]|uniref:Serine/threonine protein kinase n=1 Tax=Uabimicrobium amorphum TaxID=2596890 RepID=A0A5S9ITC6_UABAM|nr:serine/threonine-protein kinase [Candidatus Uabimicrobium amorphum]BBM86265.1 serine/threonine protein kinase [Candidatus Uabimicrobium amorphum]